MRSMDYLIQILFISYIVHLFNLIIAFDPPKLGEFRMNTHILFKTLLSFAKVPRMKNHLNIYDEIIFP